MKKLKFDNLGLRYGFYTAWMLVIYFLLMRITDLAEVLELRIINLFLLIVGILMAIDKYKSDSSKHMDYLTGLAIGVTTTLIASFTFAVFLGFYLSFDVHFMDYIKANAIMGSYLDPATAAFAVFGEGISSGIIGTFAFMQWYKRYTPQLD